MDPTRGRLLEDIKGNTMRYVGLVAEAADDAMPPPEGLPQADIYDRLLESVSARGGTRQCSGTGADVDGAAVLGGLFQEQGTAEHRALPTPQSRGLPPHALLDGKRAAAAQRTRSSWGVPSAASRTTPLLPWQRAERIEQARVQGGAGAGLIDTVRGRERRGEGCSMVLRLQPSGAQNTLVLFWAPVGPLHLCAETLLVSASTRRPCACAALCSQAQAWTLPRQASCRLR